ncbi:methyl-accepting chemotaxis protein [Geomonas sp. RF6]|uniref:methyl-accepting chemotaxis protein n=1 Tax=Geomonas sp. RF6 TaxID=2897342 RepID=UPI001E52893E|nr:methyl-accepting chemotaxis protein [Geomonas sp. RF6]UFS71524.1 methyl-accepting chemotaxis protein [Geomonas sp. RF6]
MTIKTKLTLNVVIVIIIVAAVATTSIVAMEFVKSRLHDLTQRSTPFQMRTVEFQRAIQGATADLTKVSAARTRDEFNGYKAEAEKSLEDVQSAQTALQALAGDTKIEAYGALSSIASELFTVSEGRLRANEDAVAARKAIGDRLREATARLKELDKKTKELQGSTSTSYSKSMTATTDVSGRVRDFEATKLIMKDLQLGLLQLVQSQTKKGVLISQGKCNSDIKKVQESAIMKRAPLMAADVKIVAEKFPNLVKAQMAVAGQAGADTAARDALVNEITDKMNAVVLYLDQEGVVATDNLASETRKQNSYFGNSTLATTIMAANSELLSLGLNAQGLSERLFSASNVKDVAAVEGDLNRVFSRIAEVEAELGASLKKLGARGETQLLLNAQGALNSVHTGITAHGGVVMKIRNRLEMEAKASAAMEKLREIVLQQAEKGKQTVSVAQVDQEKAISTVNRMATFSTMIIGAIGGGAILFGILFGVWIYRSVSRPLHKLLEVSHAVAGGDLAVHIDTTNNDEVGQVQMAMAEMVKNLREMFAKIKDATGSLASSSEELSATATALQRGSEEQTSRIDQSSTAMSEMTQSTVEVVQNSRDTSDAAEKMKLLANEGKGAMYVTGDELNRFAASVKATADRVESLGQQSEQITEIVTLISDIADQTNLLALNAAIEAARAGEQGRGFAVVADNVKLLAERTSEATNNIYETVKAMQESVKASIALMQEERASVDRVQEQVQQTLQAMDEITAYVERVTGMVQRIAVAAKDQSSSTEDVSRNIEGIFTIARELRTSFTDIKSSSGMLSHLASDLDTMVGWFKL